MGDLLGLQFSYFAYWGDDMKGWTWWYPFLVSLGILNYLLKDLAGIQFIMLLMLASIAINVEKRNG